MYKCLECGWTFEEPAIIREDPSPAGVSLMRGFYTYSVCPNCGDGAIEEVFDEEDEEEEDE